MPDDGRRLVELADHVLEMVGDITDGLLGEDLRVGVGLLDRLRVVGPAGSERRVSGVLENLCPPVPTAGQQPQAMDEDHRLLARSIGSVDLCGVVLVDTSHRFPPVESLDAYTYTTRRREIRKDAGAERDIRDR